MLRLSAREVMGTCRKVCRGMSFRVGDYSPFTSGWQCVDKRFRFRAAPGLVLHWQMDRWSERHLLLDGRQEGGW